MRCKKVALVDYLELPKIIFSPLSGTGAVNRNQVLSLKEKESYISYILMD